MNKEQTKMLGYIQSIKLGEGGYQDAMFGFTISFGGDGWGVCTSFGQTWDPKIMDAPPPNGAWSEDDRNRIWADGMRKLASVMHDANVTDMNDLVGKPVECTFDSPIGGTLVDWRILTEVIPNGGRKS